MSEKKIAFNCSNLSKGGGGAQIAIWFLSKYLKESDSNKVSIVFNRFIYDEISRIIDISNFNFLVVDNSPVRSLLSKLKIFYFLRKNRVSHVYSLYGPSGIYFNGVEFSGLANAWVTCANKIDFKRTFGRFALLKYVLYFFHGYVLSKKDKLIFETNISRDNFIKKFNYPLDKTIIIENTINDFFLGNNCVASRHQDGSIRILYLSSYYKHKNLEMIPFYAYELMMRGWNNILFQLTIDDDSFNKISTMAERLGVNDFVENLGFIPSNCLPEVYSNASVVLSSSDMETFSATYAEAVYCRKFLIVSDRFFSKSICKDYALYFEPSNPVSFLNAFEEAALNNFSPPEIYFSDLFIYPEDRYKKIKKIVDDFS